MCEQRAGRDASTRTSHLLGSTTSCFTITGTAPCSCFVSQRSRESLIRTRLSSFTVAVRSSLNIGRSGAGDVGRTSAGVGCVEEAGGNVLRTPSAQMCESMREGSAPSCHERTIAAFAAPAAHESLWSRRVALETRAASSSGAPSSGLRVCSSPVDASLVTLRCLLSVALVGEMAIFAYHHKQDGRYSLPHPLFRFIQTSLTYRLSDPSRLQHPAPSVPLNSQPIQSHSLVTIDTRPILQTNSC